MGFALFAGFGVEGLVGGGVQPAGGAVGCSSPDSSLRSIDLPAPFGPKKAIRLVVVMWSVTPCTAQHTAQQQLAKDAVMLA